jgi:hypothetical protein
MRTVMGILAMSAVLCAAAPARALEGPAAPPPAVPEPVPQNLLRLNLGVGIGSEGWGCRAGLDRDPYYSCSPWTYGGYIPFVLGLGVDLHLGGPSHLGLGGNVMLGSLSFSIAGFANVSQRLTVGEGYLDYVHKFGSADQGTRGRVRAGGAFYLGAGQAGGALRIGGGASFLSHSRLGMGLDLILEGGAFGGYWVSTLQIVVSPELRLW